MTTNRLPLFAAALLAVSTPAWGQAYLQQGNALDANQRVNSGGLNYGTRQYTPNYGNRIISGNAAGGMSFRGYSSVQDPSSLFIRNYSTSNVSSSGLTSGLGLSGLANTHGSLPSDALTNFRRDSVSVNNIQQGYYGGNLNRLPYYSSSSTVANTGAIVAGLNRPGSSQLISPYTSARSNLVSTPTNPVTAAGTSQGSALSIAPKLVRIDNGQTLNGQINQRLLGSSLFGAVRQVSITDLADQTQRGSGGALNAGLVEAGKTADAAHRDRTGTVGKGQDSSKNAGNPTGTPVAANGASLRHQAGEPSDSGSGDLRQPIVGPNRTPSLAERLGTAGRQPDLTGKLPMTPGANDGLFSGPIRTFVGTQIGAANQQLAEAEDLLKRGQYYRAADAYETARNFDSKSPLPVLGKSVALLGAGDYVTSANYLFIGIRLYDVMPKLHLDLTALIPDANLLETRRADLEKRLQVIDDFRLRFLLGYLQYSTGQEEAGLANMDQATSKLPAEMQQSRRFVEMLREQQKGGSTPPVAPGTQPAR